MAAIPLAYILPGLAYIKLGSTSLWSREKMPAIGLVFFGSIITICGCAVLVPNILSECKTGIVMGYCKEDEVTMNFTVKPIPTKIPFLPKFRN